MHQLTPRLFAGSFRDNLHSPGKWPLEMCELCVMGCFAWCMRISMTQATVECKWFSLVQIIGREVGLWQQWQRCSCYGQQHNNSCIWDMLLRAVTRRRWWWGPSDNDTASTQNSWCRAVQCQNLVSRYSDQPHARRTGKPFETWIVVVLVEWTFGTAKRVWVAENSPSPTPFPL